MAKKTNWFWWLVGGIGAFAAGAYAFRKKEYIPYEAEMGPVIQWKTIKDYDITRKEFKYITKGIDQNKKEYGPFIEWDTTYPKDTNDFKKFASASSQGAINA